MPTRDLLPGVTTRSCPPVVVCDAHRAIRTARRRAMLRDLMHVVLLVAVDYLFVHWPESRLPLLDRSTSLRYLAGTNVALLGHVWFARIWPRWSAQRIASTWCRSERERFTQKAPAAASSSRTFRA